MTTVKKCKKNYRMYNLNDLKWLKIIELMVFIGFKKGGCHLSVESRC